MKKIAILWIGLALLAGCKKNQHSELPVVEQTKAPALGSVAQAPANALLWRIETPKPAYLYGTIHIPDERVLALPRVVSEAFVQADVINMEIPLDPQSQMAVAGQMLLPDGETLKDVLPKKLYQRLDALFSEKNLPLAALGKLKIWAISVQVMLVDHFLDFATRQPLDLMLYTRAQKAGKIVGGLETLEEQMAIFDSLSQKEQVVLLEKTLDLLAEYKKKGVDPVEELIEVYLKGDEEALWSAMRETYDDDDPLDRKLMKRLFSDRNEKMLKRIEKKLKSAPSEKYFFAIGAGHLVGADGLVAMLRKNGFKVLRIPSRK
jgi:uncharacterized protein YbaP (TraB family)